MTSNNNTNDSRLCTIYVKPKKIHVSTENSKQDVKIKSNTKLRKIKNFRNIETNRQTTTNNEIIKTTKQNEVKQPGNTSNGHIKSLQKLKLSLKPNDLNPSRTIRNSICQNVGNTNKNQNTKSWNSSLDSENILGSCTKQSCATKHHQKFRRSSNGSNRMFQIQPSLTDDPFNFQLHSKPNFQYNKGKIQKCHSLDPEEEMSVIFRSAVAESGSSSFRENNRLPKLVYQALKQRIPWHVIENTLQECGAEPIIDINCFLIQLRFHKKLHLICTIRSNDIMSFKKSLMPLLKKHKTSLESVLSNFYSYSIIEALASYCTPIDFAKFERTLAKDAVDCSAKTIKILDYETGLVNFQCHPLELPTMVDELQKKRYRILYTDYGFRPLDCVALQADERKAYTRFLCDLRKYKEIENCYDDLAPLVREKEEKVVKIQEKQSKVEKSWNF